MSDISKDVLFMKKEVYPKCIMCRKELTKDDYSEEHIYPKWLQKKYGLQNKSIELPNGINFSYKRLKVPCCTECNNGKMSNWENIIKNAVESGYDEFIKLDKEIIAWWLYKLYYSKLVKETQMRRVVCDEFSGKLVQEEQLWKYNHLFGYMNALLNGVSFSTDVPYELYIFKTDNNHNFDYLDIIETNTLLVMMDDILIVCALDTCGKFKKHYKRELDILKSMEKVHHLQGIELFVRISYYRDHYKIDAMPENLPIGPMPENHVALQKIDCKAKREFLDIELYILIVRYLTMRAPDMSFPDFVPGKMITTIIEK